MRRTPIVLLALCGLLLVACGDDDDDSAGGGGGGDFCKNMAKITKLMESDSESDVNEGVELMKDTTPPDEIADDWKTFLAAAEPLLGDDASQADIAAAQSDIQKSGGGIDKYYSENCDEASGK